MGLGQSSTVNAGLGAQFASVDEALVMKLASANEAKGKVSSCPPLMMRSISSNSTTTADNSEDESSYDGIISPVSLGTQISWKTSSEVASPGTPDTGNDVASPRHPHEMLTRDMPVQRTFIHFNEASVGSSRRTLSAPGRTFWCQQMDTVESQISPRATKSRVAASGKDVTLVPSAPAVPTAPPPLSAPVNLPRFPEGTEVEIDGLARAPQFNGLVAVVQSFDPETDRYDVVIHGVVGTSNTARAKVKGVNLRSRAPPAPCFAPTLDYSADSTPPPPSFAPTVIDTFHIITYAPDSTPPPPSFEPTLPSSADRSNDSPPGTPRWEDQAQPLGAWVELQPTSTASTCAPVARWEAEDQMLAAWGEFPQSCLREPVSSAGSWWETESQAFGVWQYDGCNYVECGL